MVSGIQLRLLAAAIVMSLVALEVPRVSGQGLQNVLRAQSRVFPAVGPGVAAIQRDSSGRYFVLAEPASIISIFDVTGKRLGQFPNDNSHGATIRYAVAIDVDSRGRLLVVDRGDNAIKIFAPDGSLLAKIHVTAPTSVVALSDGQFAVTTLQSKQLVQIMDDKGTTIRTFGDPADQPNGESPEESVMDRGRITGDHSGNIYFAFTSLPNPTLQRFDRFGYAAYASAISATQFGPLAGRTGHEIHLGYTMSGLYGPESVGAWTDLRSLTALSVGSRVRPGPGGGASSSAAYSTSSPFSTSSSAAGTTSFDGNILDFSPDGTPDALETNSSIFGAGGDPNLGLAYGQGMFMPGMFATGFGDMFHDGMRGGFHDGGVAGPALGGASPNFGGTGPSPGDTGGNFADHFPDGRDGFHARPGFGLYRAAATVRLGLDDPSKSTSEKPVITAVGVDPQTQEVWTAVNDVLVHLDKVGNRMDSYYPAISGATSLKITSILVESDRILMAIDPWGIYDFPRPDRPSQTPAPPNNIITQPLQPATPSPASH